MPMASTNQGGSGDGADTSSVELRAILDRAPVFLAYVDALQRYRFVNARSHEVFGRAPEAIVGRQVREVLGEELYASARPYIDAALAGRDASYEHALAVSG